MHGSAQRDAGVGLVGVRGPVVFMWDGDGDGGTHGAAHRDAFDGVVYEI